MRTRNEMSLGITSVFTYKFYPITRSKARTVSDQLCRFRTWSKSLLYNLITQGLLLADWNVRANSIDEKAVVKFEYEQMEDVIRAIAFLSKQKLLNSRNLSSLMSKKRFVKRDSINFLLISLSFDLKNSKRKKL